MFTVNDTSGDLPMRVWRWHVAFWKKPVRASWHHWLARGPYKHVSAFGYSARCNVWCFYNPAGNAEQIEIVRNRAEEFLPILDYIKHRADLLAVQIGDRAHAPWRPGCYCVPQIVRLLGVRTCALTPGGLYFDLVRQGARPSTL